MNLSVISLVFVAVRFASSARVLGFFPVASFSHQQVYRSFMYELSRRGHQVTIVTPDPLKVSTPNYTEIDISFSYDVWRKKYHVIQRGTPEVVMFDFMQFFVYLVDQQLSVDAVRRMIRDGQFDLIVVEFILSPSLCALSHHFRAPLIGITSLDALPATQVLIGNPFNPAYYPDMLLSYGDKKPFFGRVRSVFSYLFWLLTHHYYLLPKHDVLAKKHFGPDTPYIGDIERNVSLILANSDATTGFAFPVVPAYIPIGGGNAIHLGKRSQLPKDIQEFMDGAKEGVIYFSLGSNVKSKTMPENKRKILTEAFRRVKQKVLWKWEDDVLPDKPDNVKIGKWLPQTDILAHPNLKAFITQGGLQSISEATYNSVPMIVIPFFADQELNAKKLTTEDVAIRIDYESLELESFSAALQQIINNPKYKQNIVRYSALTKDQPQNPMDKAIWWTEYVIRHKGARHLRSAAADMPWYQYFLLDVFAFLAVVAFAFLYVTFITMRFLARLLFKTSKHKRE